MVKLTPKFKRGENIFVAYVVNNSFIRFVGPVQICEVTSEVKWMDTEFTVDCSYKVNSLNERFMECVCYATKDEAWHNVNLQLEQAIAAATNFS